MTGPGEPTVVREWAVRLPDGHLYACQTDRESAESMVASLGGTLLTCTVTVTRTPWETVQASEPAPVRVWRHGDPQPADGPTVRDRIMRAWAPQEGVWHTPSSGGRYWCWEMLLARFGPLTEVPGDGGGAAT